MTATEKAEDSAPTGSRTSESLVWFTALPTVMQVIRFVNSILLARILMPRDFGIIGIASVIVYYCNSLTNFGLGNAIVQRKEIDSSHINAFFTFNLTVSILLALVFVFSAGAIASFFRIKELEQVVTLFSLMFLITSVYSVGQTKLRRDLSFKQLALNDAAKTLCAMAISLPLALAGYAYWSLLVAILCSSAIAAVTINIRAKWVPKPSFRRKALMELFSFASWNFVSLQVRLLSEYLDKLVVGRFLGPASLGYYEKAYGISQMPNEQVGNNISVVAFSTFSRFQDNPGELHYYFFRIFSTVTFMVCPIYFGMLAISDIFVLTLLGEKWQPMIPTFRVLLASFMVSSFTALFSTLNITCGKYRQDAKFRLYCLAIYIPVLLVSARNGIVFAAAAVLLHNLAFLLFSMRLAGTAVSIQAGSIGKCIYPAGLGGIIMFTVLLIARKYVLSEPTGVNLCLLIFIGVICYGGWFLGTDFLNWRFLKVKLRAAGARMIKIYS